MDFTDEPTIDLVVLEGALSAFMGAEINPVFEEVAGSMRRDVRHLLYYRASAGQDSTASAWVAADRKRGRR